MCKVVLAVEGSIHQVADDVCILRNLNSQSIFNGSNCRKSMNPGTYTANTFYESPCITWIAAFEDDFQTSPHCACGHGIDNNVVVVHDGLHT